MGATVLPGGADPQGLAEKAENSSETLRQAAAGTDSDDGVTMAKGGNASTGAEAWDWSKDDANPYNWPSGRKAMQIAIVALMAFLTYVDRHPK